MRWHTSTTFGGWYFEISLICNSEDVDAAALMTGADGLQIAALQITNLRIAL
jgi:hypothetical protein